MKCPNCDGPTRVIEARLVEPKQDKPAYDYKRRRRECIKCRLRFPTRESHHPTPPAR